MKTLLIALMCAFSVSSFAQIDPGLLIGKWNYKDIYEKEKLEAESIKMLEMFFKDLSFQFDKSGAYKMTLMGGAEQGEWEAKDDITLALTSDKGQVTEMQVVNLTDDELSVKLEKGAFVLEKAKTKAKKIVKEKPKLKTVSATKSQVAQKWYLDKRESDKKLSKEVLETSQALLKGSFIQFKSNGKYKTKVLKLKEKGTWSFGENNTSIVTKKDKQQQIWNIVKVSDDELILVQGKDKQKWIFKK